MKYSLKLTKLSLPQDMADYIEKKMATLGKLIARFGSAVKTAVEIERTTRHHRKGDVFRVEVRVSAPYKTLQAEGLGESVREAMDKAKDEIALELERHKEKTIDREKRGARKAKEILKNL